MATYFVDFVGGNDANTGTSFILRKKTLGSASLVAAPGDLIKVMQSAAPQAFNVGHWTFGSSIVQLASNNTVTLSNGATAALGSNIAGWQPFDPVHLAVSTDTAIYRQTFPGPVGSIKGTLLPGPTSQKMVLNTALINFQVVSNSYRYISCWFRSDTSLAIGALNCLVSPSGFTPGTGPGTVNMLNTVAIPANTWTPLLFDPFPNNGVIVLTANAGYIVFSVPSANIWIDNLIAVKDRNPGSPLVRPYITHGMLVGKLGEPLRSIQSIDNTNLVLDYSPMAPAGQSSLYAGDTETITTYAAVPIAPVATLTNYQVLNAVGTSGSPIQVSGGWDSAAMTTQVGQTWVDGTIGTGVGVLISGNHIHIDPSIGFCRFATGWSITGTDPSGAILAGNNCTSAGINITSAGDVTGLGAIQGLSNLGNGINVLNTGFYVNSSAIQGSSNAGTGVRISGQSRAFTGAITGNCNGNGCVIASGGMYPAITTISNLASGATFSNSTPAIVQVLTASSNGQLGTHFLNATSSVDIYTYNSGLNAVASVGVSSTGKNEHSFYHANISDSTKVASSIPAYSDSRIHLQHTAGTFNNNFTYSDGANVSVDFATPNTLGGLDYVIAITSANRNANYPYRHLVMPVAVVAGSIATVSCWVKRNSATNVSANLIVPGGQIAGVPSDVITSITGTTYTQYTVIFTPSEDGVVEVFLDVWTPNGNTTGTVAIADLSALQ